MQRMLHKKAPEPAVLEQRNVIELAVCSGSSVSGKLIKDIPWPPNTLLVDVKRGESQLIPAGRQEVTQNTGADEGEGDLLHRAFEAGQAVKTADVQ